jgi:hypothetical protein
LHGFTLSLSNLLVQYLTAAYLCSLGWHELSRIITSVWRFSEYAELKYVILFMDSKVRIINGVTIFEINCESMQIKRLKYFLEDVYINSAINFAAYLSTYISLLCTS